MADKPFKLLQGDITEIALWPLSQLLLAAGRSRSSRRLPHGAMVDTRSLAKIRLPGVQTNGRTRLHYPWSASLLYVADMRRDSSKSRDPTTPPKTSRCNLAILAIVRPLGFPPILRLFSRVDIVGRIVAGRGGGPRIVQRGRRKQPQALGKAAQAQKLQIVSVVCIFPEIRIR